MVKFDDSDALIILNEDNSIIDKEYELFLKNKCENFNVELSPFNNGKDHINYFYRDFIDVDEDISKSMVERAEEFVRKNINSDKYSIGRVWINRVDTNSNKGDGFHFDHSAISLVIYINDDFEGGEFEYIDKQKNKIQIKPKKGLAILLNNKIAHRVKPVSYGIRYSLVFFLTLRAKIQKSII